MTTLTLDRATDEQIKQLARVASDAAEKAVKDYFKGNNVSKEGAQRVHGNGNFAARVREGAILALAELSTDKYQDEEMKSSYGYLSGYTKPKSITEQYNILHQIFPGIGFADEKVARRELPAGAEGYFAIPRWQTIAPTYGEALQKVLNALKKAYRGKFYNHREGQLGSDQLRQSAKSVAFWEQIGNEQKDHDILVIPAQFGIRHRGRSVRRAHEVMEANECGLGAFAVGIMLLTHMDRLQSQGDLWIECAGDEFHDPLHSDTPFGRALYFSFDSGKVEFGTIWSGHAYVYYGSVSGWLVPQS